MNSPSTENSTANLVEKFEDYCKCKSLLPSSLFDCFSEEVFWVGSPNGKQIILATKGYEKIWGRPLKSIYKKNWSWEEGIHSLDKEQVKKDLSKFFHSGQLDHEFRIIRPDGEICWIRNRVMRIQNKKGETTGIVGLAQDISRIKNLEERNYIKRNLLEKKDFALKELLHLFESNKIEIYSKIKLELNTYILPIINLMKLAQSFQPKLLQRLSDSLNNLTSNLMNEKEACFNNLSQKELEVANLIRMGHSTKEIAELLNLSTHTITTYRYRMRSKLGIKSNKVGLDKHLKQPY